MFSIKTRTSKLLYTKNWTNDQNSRRRKSIKSPLRNKNARPNSILNFNITHPNTHRYLSKFKKISNQNNEASNISDWSSFILSFIRIKYPNWFIWIRLFKRTEWRIIIELWLSFKYVYETCLCWIKSRSWSVEKYS